MVAAAGALAAPRPAGAIFGLFEPSLQAYTIDGRFNVTVPRDWKVKRQDPNAIFWQGDRIQPLDRTSAFAKAVKYDSLAAAFGANASEVGARLAAKRSQGAAALRDAQVDPTGAGLDAYLFEFEGTKTHELELLVMLREGEQNVLCDVLASTPSLMWEDKEEALRSVVRSFQPLAAAAAAASAP